MLDKIIALKKQVLQIALFFTIALLSPALKAQVNQYDALKKLVKNINDIQLEVSGHHFTTGGYKAKAYFSNTSFDIFFYNWKGYLSESVLVDIAGATPAICFQDSLDFSDVTDIYGEDDLTPDISSDEMQGVNVIFNKPVKLAILMEGKKLSDTVQNNIAFYYVKGDKYKKKQLLDNLFELTFQAKIHASILTENEVQDQKAAWKKACEINIASAYKDFIKTYPNSIYIKQAKFEAESLSPGSGNAGKD
ncbi:MAG: hypothetical protein V4592_06470 [Bacteroidota bacterium]